MSNTDLCKHRAAHFIERNAAAMTRLGDMIFYYGELGMQEHRTSALLTKILAEGGFSVERNLSGFPTGFLASYGTGDPVIALHCEFDANPGNSQASGATERAEIVPGAPGHCEGHNVNAAVVITAALAVKAALQAQNVPGTIKVFGAPAEEQLISRPYFVRDGHFDDVDIAFHAHIMDELGTEYGLVQLGMMSVQFTFHGVAAHSAMSPWEGRDALDAAVLMDVGMAQFREHMRPGMSAHRVFTEGGAQPNVIPSRTTCWWFLRDRDPDGVRRLYDQAERVARGAALMANCEVTTEVLSGVWPVRCNETVARAIERNIEAVGMPVWTAQERDFARAVQKGAGKPQIGLRETPAPLRHRSEPMAASNDCGDISWVVPMGRVWFPSNIPHAAFHHWSAGAALTTSIAHKGALVGAKVLAASALDFITSVDAVQDAWRTFEAETAGTTYRSLLPAGQQPPVELNRALMERYRPLMEPHYLQGDPQFVLGETA
ncbi:MAG: amidohydrolase [Hyphomicrobiales bacterium]|nr:amidohydrolase [Hyphomicrobiales bacterium]